MSGDEQFTIGRSSVDQHYYLIRSPDKVYPQTSMGALFPMERVVHFNLKDEELIESLFDEIIRNFLSHVGKVETPGLFQRIYSLFISDLQVMMDGITKHSTDTEQVKRLQQMMLKYANSVPSSK